jgi:hypothetical protein
MLTVVPDDGGDHEGAKDGTSSLIDEIVREGARGMLAEALQAGVDACIAQFAAERDENGRRLVVRNGYHRSREVLTSAGAVEVTAPRLSDKRTGPDTGERKRFSPAILPAWARTTPKITEVLPLLYLHGLSSGDFVPALGQFPGSAVGLSGPGDHEALHRRTSRRSTAGHRASAATRLAPARASSACTFTFPPRITSWYPRKHLRKATRRPADQDVPGPPRSSAGFRARAGSRRPPRPPVLSRPRRRRRR